MKYFTQIIHLCIISIYSIIARTNLNNDENINQLIVSFQPDNTNKILVDTSRSLNVTLHSNSTHNRKLFIHISILDTSIALLKDGNETILLLTKEINIQNDKELTFTIFYDGVFIGRTSLNVKVLDQNGLTITNKSYPLVVIRQNGRIVDLFIVISGIFVLIINIGFGCSLDVKLMWEIMRKPIAPVIGVVCQFLLMPLIGFGVTQLFQMKPEFSFGVIVVACAPGGGGSNIWAMLYGGDLDLSLAMTFFSKILAVGMMPFWMWTFAEFYIGENDIKIPYDHIALGLFTIALPCSLGIYINKYYPKQSEWLKSAVKPLAFLFIIFAVAAGSWVNYFVYSYMFSVWYIIPACMLLPYIGFSLGYVLARLCGQPFKQAATIALETGIQDNGISIFLLLATFSSPDGDIIATIPVTIALVTPLPLITIYGIILLRRKMNADKSNYTISEYIVDNSDTCTTKCTDIDAFSSNSDEIKTKISSECVFVMPTTKV